MKDKIRAKLEETSLKIKCLSRNDLETAHLTILKISLMKTDLIQYLCTKTDNNEKIEIGELDEKFAQIVSA